MHARTTRLASLLGGTAVLAASVALLPGGTSSATPGPGGGTTSPLTLWAPTEVIAQTWRGNAYTNLGLRVVAPDAAVEIWSQRASYDDPVVATWVQPDGTRVTLPEGSMTSFTGLTDFVDVTITRPGSAQPLTSMTLPGCLNGRGQRIHPDAPARSPYPQGCPWNPYTLGSVMGVQAGWSNHIVDEWGMSLPLKQGEYDVTATIADAYVTAFGIEEADATRTFTLKVVKEDGSFRPRAPRSADGPPAPGERGLEERPMTAEGAQAGPLPDLRSLPAWDIQVNRKSTALRFAANVWNAGDSPLVVEGFREDSDDHLHTYQFFFDSDGEQVGRTPEPVGEMGWHAGNHNHWHFEDFAQYRLEAVEGGQVVKSRKQSFCLANTDAVDYTVPGADWQPGGTDLSTACDGRGALSVRQVLSAGSGDTYYQYRVGQAFRLKNVPDGLYNVVVEANPVLNLVESDTTNNVSERLIKIRTVKRGPDKGDRRVKAFPVGIIDESGSFGFFRNR